MTELKIDFELDFDLKDDEVATAGGERIVFDRIRLIRIPGYPTKTEGVELTLPGIFNWLYDEGTKTYLNQGQRKFVKLVHDPKAKSSLFFLVSEREQKNGTVYQKVLHYYSGDKEKWQKLQRPELLKLSEADQGKVTKQYVYSRHTEKDTTRSYTGNDGKTYYDQYYADFIIYPTRETWQADKDEHFAHTGGSEENGATPTFDTSNFPGSSEWASDDPATLAGNWQSIRDVIQGNGTNASTFVQTAAEDLYLINKRTGQPVKRLNGDAPVDLAELFAAALEIPVDDEMRQVFEVANIKKVLGIK